SFRSFELTAFLGRYAPGRRLRRTASHLRHRPGIERADHDDRLAVLILRRRLYLVARQVRRDAVGLAARREMQGIPVDHDPAATDTEKAAEIDDGGTDLPAAIDQDVDDPPHVLVRNAADLIAQDALHLPLAEH